MLATYLRRLEQPVRYAATPAMHPLAFLTQALLASGEYKHYPLIYPEMRHLPAARTAESAHGAVNQGIHTAFPDLLNALKNVTHPSEHDNLDLLRQVYEYRSKLPHDDPLIQAYTPGSFLYNLGRQVAGENIRTYGSPLQSAKTHLTGQDLENLRTPLRNASTTPNLGQLLLAHHAIRRELGRHGHGYGSPVQELWRGVNRPLNAGTAAAEDTAGQMRSGEFWDRHKTDYRPNEMVPEDYYSHG